MPIPPPTGPFPPGPPGSGLFRRLDLTPAVGRSLPGFHRHRPPVLPLPLEMPKRPSRWVRRCFRSEGPTPSRAGAPTVPMGCVVTASGLREEGQRPSGRHRPIAARSAGSGDPAVDDEDTGRRRWGLIVVVVLALLAAAAGGYLFYRKVVHPDTVPATAPDVAKAAAVNLRLTDLPAGFTEQALPPIGSPPASVPRRRKALGTMASCLDVPLSSVQGWFGTGPFPQQITVVRSPTFGDPTVPTVQMFSSTALVAASDSTSAAQEAALGSPKFPACYGQYQVAALAVPVTGQVPTFPLTAPSGTKAYGFLTMFTLADGATELVGEAFILGSGVTTRSKPPPMARPSRRSIHPGLSCRHGTGGGRLRVADFGPSAPGLAVCTVLEPTGAMAVGSPSADCMERGCAGDVAFGGNPSLYVGSSTHSVS